MPNELRTEKGFVIGTGGDDENDIRPQKWTLSGPFEFRPREEFDAFAQKLVELFEGHVTGGYVGISTVEAFELCLRIEREQARLPLEENSQSETDSQNRMALQKASKSLTMDEGIEPSHTG